MGVTNSKAERSEALRLCRERKRYIKAAIDSRCALAAAHVAYVQSLRNIGVALRRFAEAEVLIESSLSTFATEIDKTPSHSSYPSPSPPHIAGVPDSPVLNGSPLSPSMTRLSYMKSGGTSAVTFSVNPSRNVYVDDIDSMAFPMPPPPPPPESGPSWDFFFDPTDDSESFRFVGNLNGFNMGFDDATMYRQFSEKQGDLDGTNENHDELRTPESENKVHNMSGNSVPRGDGGDTLVAYNAHSVKPHGIECSTQQADDSERKGVNKQGSANALVGTSTGKAALEQASSKTDKSVVDKDICAEREDPSEFITHRAKDFLSSIKDIEHRFFRSSESGKEVSRMLESNKIRVGYIEAKGRSVSAFSAACHLVCCQGKTGLVSHEPSENMTKVITWKRSASSQSSSSRNPLATASKDDNDDSGSDFVEEFCMIAGSHSSSLDRLYAWERKLYDEVKASESIRKEYDRKCDQLRHQFAKDLSAQVIDKTRAVVKDLHSRIRVALHAVDSISKRIEKMRDEELLPQLLELIHGLIRMWKAMLECHHAQYITISLAYHAKSSGGTPQEDTQRQIMAQLQDEIECFGLSFADWINSHTSYVEALNSWLQNCIQQPRERSKGRRAFSPRRVIAPQIFVLCRDWSAGIKALPSEELSDAIKAFLSDLRHSIGQQTEEQQKKHRTPNSGDNEDLDGKDEEKNDDGSSNVSCIHSSLTKVLDRLTKFSEASLKMYLDIQQKSETARSAYCNYKPPRSFSI
ncbi:unnamed protein product [Ilex paraguariensis]|uniref:BZIP transcription factor n=1 Tax=Ilex paraguariensis TaxID=185542 RepID=A0ABC8QV67_9AQUA